MGSAERTDAELAQAWAAGEDGAFDAVYRAHAAALFGTAVGLVGDRTAAADVVHDTFLRAATRVGGLRDPARLRAWLFAILRNQAVGWHRSRSRIAGGLDEGAVPVSEWLADQAPAADTELSRRELADLVWTAADGLQPRDREVLELHLRGGLEASDLAQVMGVTAGHAAVLLSRMRDRLQRCLGAVLVARWGRADCAGLDRVLADWDGRFTLAVRGTVTRHVESCDVCGRRRAALVSLEHLAPVIVPPAVVLPEELHARLVADLVDPDRVVAALDQLDQLGQLDQQGPAGRTGQEWAWREDGFPWPVPDLEPDGVPTGLPEAPAPRSRAGVAMVAAAVLVLGAVGVGAGLWRPGDSEITLADRTGAASGVAAFPDGAPGDASAPSTPVGGVLLGGADSTPVPGGPGLLSPTSPGAPGVPGTPSAGVTPGATGAPTSDAPPVPGTTPSGGISGTPGTTSSRPAPTPGTTTSSPPPQAPPEILRVAASPTQVRVPGQGCTPTTATVTVAVLSETAVTGSVRWQVGTTSGSATLSPGQGGLTGTVGPFRVAGSAALEVSVRNSGGTATAATKLSVLECLDVRPGLVRPSLAGAGPTIVAG